MNDSSLCDKYELADVEGHVYVLRRGTDTVVAEFDDPPVLRPRPLSLIARILQWPFIDSWRDWNAPADRLTRYEIWRVITGGLFVASPFVMWFCYERLPPLAVLAAVYFIGFPVGAGTASIIHDPPRFGPNTERCGGEN